MVKMKPALPNFVKTQGFLALPGLHGVGVTHSKQVVPGPYSGRRYVGSAVGIIDL